MRIFLGPIVVHLRLIRSSSLCLYRNFLRALEPSAAKQWSQGLVFRPSIVVGDQNKDFAGPVQRPILLTSSQGVASPHCRHILGENNLLGRQVFNFSGPEMRPKMDLGHQIWWPRNKTKRLKPVCSTASHHYSSLSSTKIYPRAQHIA